MEADRQCRRGISEKDCGGMTEQGNKGGLYVSAVSGTGGSAEDCGVCGGDCRGIRCGVPKLSAD